METVKQVKGELQRPRDQYLRGVDFRGRGHTRTAQIGGQPGQCLWMPNFAHLEDQIQDKAEEAIKTQYNKLKQGVCVNADRSHRRCARRHPWIWPHWPWSAVGEIRQTVHESQRTYVRLNLKSLQQNPLHMVTITSRTILSLIL